MRYAHLHDLIRSSSSARQYFLSLPVFLQMELHTHGDYIHTAEELHRRVHLAEKYRRSCEIADGTYTRHN